MKNSDFLLNYIKLQTGIMYDRIADLGFSIVVAGETYSSPFFNYAQVNSLIFEGQLKQIEKQHEKFDRKPTIYFENRPNLKPLIDFLIQHGYAKHWEDSWMFHDGKNINTSRFNQVKKVTNEQELKQFIKTFDTCYQEGDPQNPYGTLGDYLKVAEESWHKHHDTDRIEYFTIFDGKQPVAVSTLTNFAGIGYISNVGSLKGVRGQGFGKVASLYCVIKSQEHGNEVHALATEEGDYPNKFYKRIGFKTKFSADGYVKK